MGVPAAFPRQYSMATVELVSVRRAPAPHKLVAKFRVTRAGKTTVRRTLFGRVPYRDYTQHKDKARRERYRARHEKDLATKDPTRAGWCAYWILWGDSTSRRKNVEAFRKLVASRTWDA